MQHHHWGGQWSGRLLTTLFTGHYWSQALHVQHPLPSVTSSPHYKSMGHLLVETGGKTPPKWGSHPVGHPVSNSNLPLSRIQTLLAHSPAHDPSWLLAISGSVGWDSAELMQNTVGREWIAAPILCHSQYKIWEMGPSWNTFVKTHFHFILLCISSSRESTSYLVSVSWVFVEWVH